MAGGAFAVLHWLVLHLGFGDLLREIVVTLGAQFSIGLGEQVL